MQDEKFKQLYAFFSLIMTLIWAAFCVLITYRALLNKEAIDILASSGANTMLGAMLVWNGNINQFFYRRERPATPDTSTTTINKTETTTEPPK